MPNRGNKKWGVLGKANNIEGDPMMVELLQISKYKSNVIDTIINQYTTKTDTKLLYNLPRAADQVSSVLDSVDPLINEKMTYERMEERAKLSDYMISVGSTNADKPEN